MDDTVLEPILRNTNKGVILVTSDCNVELVSERASEYLGIERGIEGLSLTKIKLGVLFNDLLHNQASVSSLTKYESQKYDIDFTGGTVYISPKSKENIYEIEAIQSEGSELSVILIKKDVKPEYQDLLELNSDLIAFIHSPDNVELRYVEDQNIVSKDFLNKIHYKDISPVMNILEEVYNEDYESFSIPCRIDINNKWRVYNLKIHSENTLTNISHSIITGNDITNQYIAEQRRLVINRILRHDLRNDMNIIKGYADLLVGEDETEEAAQKIVDKSDRVIRLTNEIREIDHDLYRVNRRLKKLNVNRLIRKTVTSIQNDYEDVSVRLDLCSHNKVIANSLLESAFHHILKNAVIHNTKTEKEIQISSSYDQNTNMVSIVIKDNGPGIDMNIKKIIESGVETPLRHTTGLGLWIVKWVIEILDGQLSITNRKKSDGTRVDIKIHHESEDIDLIRQKTERTKSDFDRLPGLTDSEDQIGTTTRV